MWVLNHWGGKGFFLAHNRCYKNQSLPSTSCHAKKNSKIGKVNLVKKIDMVNICHMPPSEAMQLYWGLCKVSYCEGVFCLIFSKKMPQIFLKTVESCEISLKYPFTVTDFAQPLIKLHSFGRWHMKDMEHIYLFHKMNFSNFRYFFAWHEVEGKLWFL